MVEMLFEIIDGRAIPLPPNAVNGPSARPDITVCGAEQASVLTGHRVHELVAMHAQTWPTQPLAAVGPAERDEVVRQMIYPQLSPEAFRAFKVICDDRGFSICSRQLFPEFQFDPTTGRNKLIVIASITALGAVACRSGDYDGPEPYQFAGDDGEFKPIWDDRNGPPVWARAGVRRKSYSRPIYADAQWNTYAPYSPSTAGPVLDPIWERQGSAQLAKCALALALRTAFPDELSGLYGVEEMRQAKSMQPMNRSASNAAPAEADLDNQAGEDEVTEEEFNDLLERAGPESQRALLMQTFKVRYSKLWRFDQLRFYRVVASDLRQLIREQAV